MPQFQLDLIKHNRSYHWPYDEQIIYIYLFHYKLCEKKLN